MVFTASFDLVAGTIGVFLNVAVALALREDQQNQGATTRFMVQLALADALALFGQMFGPSVATLVGYKPVPEMILSKIFVLCNSSGYWGSGIFVALTSFSRWVYFAKKEKTDIWFNPFRFTIICTLAWITVFTVHSPFFYTDDPFTFLPNSGIFIYTNSTYSQTLRALDTGLNICAAFNQILFNFLATIWIVKLREQVTTPELRALNRRELRLFTMCFIDSAVFTILVIISFIQAYAENDAVNIIQEIFVFSNHMDCAVLYLSMNPRFRMAMSEFFKKFFKCKSTVQPTPVFQLTATATRLGSEARRI